MCCLSARCQFETLLGWDRRQPLLPWGDPSEESRFHLSKTWWNVWVDVRIFVKNGWNWFQPQMDGVISIMTTFVGALIFNHTHLNRSLSLVQSSKTPKKWSSKAAPGKFLLVDGSMDLYQPSSLLWPVGQVPSCTHEFLWTNDLS